MADVYTTIASTDVSVIGGPTQVDVAVDFGIKGDRGSLFMYGNGKPSEVELPESPDIYDMYINLNPNDTEYKYVYQYISTPSGNDWVSRFKMVPDVYTTSLNQTFVDGEKTIYISAAAVVGNNERAASLLSANNYSVLATIHGDKPIALSVSVGDITPNNNVYAIPITVNTASMGSDGSWTKISGEHKVSLQISVI